MTEHIYVIAEAGVNHNGDPERAIALVEAAAAAGADAVKFQTFNPGALATRTAPQADYQVRNEGDSGGQYAMLRRLVLSHEAHHQVLAESRRRGIAFLSSPFDAASASFLIENLGLRRLKLGSGELTNAPLLLEVAQAGCELIVSTGMATLEEIRESLGVLAFGYLGEGRPTSRADCHVLLDDPATWTVLREKVCLLHCTTEYPCPVVDVNLRAMATLADAFGLPVGYSDHTEGLQVAIAAAAREATILEKHLTQDRSLAGPDHAVSLEPGEFATMVKAVRAVSLALGSAEKVATDVERKNLAVSRKSIVAARPIREGELFSEENLAVKRPGSGRSPMDYWDLLGKPAPRDYQIEELIG